MQPYARRHYRWHFVLWVVETASWLFATAFIDSTTVLPVLVQLLSGSPFLISPIISIRYAGQGWPQLFTASSIAGRSHRKAYYLWVIIPGRLILLLPAFLLLTDSSHTRLTVAAILLAYLGFWVSEGFSIVPCEDIMGKTIPSQRRGRLFALMHAIGGVLGTVAGLLTRRVLNLRPSPGNYGILFLLALIGPGVSILAPVLLVNLQALFGFSVLPAPFYIINVSELLRQTMPTLPRGASAGVGLFLATQTAGTIVGNSL